MTFIFTMSSQTADVSSKTSGKVIEKVAQVVVKDYKKKPIKEKESIIQQFQHITRKTAHFSIYGLLGILSFLTLITYKGINIKLRLIFSFLISVLYASSDEIHQLFVSGRGGQITDVLIDSSGALLGIIVVSLIFYFSKKLKKYIF